MTGTLSGYLTATPAGYALGTGENAGEGNVTATEFDQNTQAGLAKELGYVDGYDVFFDANDSDNSVEVTLFRFGTDAGASRFSLLLAAAENDPAEDQRTGSDADIPGSATLDATKVDPKEGTDFTVIGRTANVVFSVDYEGNVVDSAYSAVAASVAKAQYRVLLTRAESGGAAT